MIFGNINDAKQYNVLNTYENMKIALDYLKEGHFMDEVNTKTPINGDLVFAFKNIVNTKGFENYFEVHHKYADVFYCVKGQEDVYFTSAKKLHPLEDFIEEIDIVHGTVDTYQKITLQVGDYIILFPEDAHAPGRGNGELLEKIVVKVKV